jgi:phosphatidylglycerophosphatase A
MIRIIFIAAIIGAVVWGLSVLYVRALRLAGDPALVAELSPRQRWLAAQVATLGGVGRITPAPGTWGSVATIPAVWILHGLGGFPLVALATLATFLGGLWATAAYAPQGDPAEVVVDEAAGMALALWPLSLGLWSADADAWVFPWPGWLLGLALFRAFDIWKPWPVSRLDAIPGPWGVMLDDVAAGAIAAILAGFAAAIAHGWL